MNGGKRSNSYFVEVGLLGKQFQMLLMLSQNLTLEEAETNEEVERTKFDDAFCKIEPMPLLILQKI